MKKRGICLLPDACYLSELNVPGKPNRTNLGECAAIQRFLSTHPNENLAILTPYRNQRALLAGTAKKSSYPQEVSLTVHRAQEREWDTVLFSVVDTTGKFFTTTLNPQNCGTQIINTAVSRAKNRLILVCDCNDWGDQPKKLIAQLLQVAQSI